MPEVFVLVLRYNSCRTFRYPALLSYLILVFNGNFLFPDVFIILKFSCSAYTHKSADHVRKSLHGHKRIFSIKNGHLNQYKAL